MALFQLKKVSLEFYRRQLASVDALPQLAILAVTSGIFAGAVILLFRMAIETSLSAALPGGKDENFEDLSPWMHLALPLAGALLLGILLSQLKPSQRRVGVVHVMERLSRHQGYLPVRNALVQFFGGILALATGQSGGREGPAVHLGAASASFLGQAFRLPNNSMRTLIACGTASAIAGSFNTPITGVIFAMEVVMMDYTIASFIPVIIAAVTTTLMTRFAYGSDPAFILPALHIHSLFEIPWVAFCGVVVGTVAAAFIALVQQFSKLDSKPIWQRIMLAGLITGLAALVVPQIMGVGYDTVNQAMLGEMGLQLLLLVGLLKLITSAACSGLGVPVGLIGPTLVIGACVGGAMGHFGTLVSPNYASESQFYVMLGMAAMMAAVLQAPLAALMTITELTANANIILPGMLIIVMATMTTSEVFGRQGLFLSMLKTLGLKYPPDPVVLHLQRAGIASIMHRDFVRLENTVSVESASRAMELNPSWIVVETESGRLRSLLAANDLKIFLQEHTELAKDDSIKLMELPGMRKDIAPIDVRATLHEGLEKLNSTAAEALCVTRTTAPLIAPVVGVVTREDIDPFARLSS